MRSNLYKGDHPDLAESLNSLGVSYERLGDDNKGLEFYLKCFEMRSNLYNRKITGLVFIIINFSFKTCDKGL